MITSTPSTRRPRRKAWIAATAVTAAAAAALATAVTGSSAGATSAQNLGLFHPANYQQINLVSDVPGAAALTDPNLVNVWGLSDAPGTAAAPGGALWVSDNGTDLSTLYTGGGPGKPAAISPLVVKIPGGEPTGQIFNPGTGFVLSTEGKTGPAKFVFASEDGDITAWNPSGVITDAVTVAHTEGAIYKGIALDNSSAGPVLLATDFHNNKVNIFDSTFAPVKIASAFQPIGVPKGFGAFNVATIGNDVYVSYAKQDADREDDVAGAGNGVVNVFDKNGHFKRQLLAFNLLNSPWAITVAPAGFGAFSGDVLVGNFGSGLVRVFDPTFGLYLGTLHGTDGKDLAIPGLWALLAGNGNAGAPSDLVFSAGPDGEAHGLLGLLRVAS